MQWRVSMCIGVVCAVCCLASTAAGQTIRPCQCNDDCVLNSAAVCVPAEDAPFDGKCCPGSWKCPDATAGGMTCNTEDAGFSDADSSSDTGGYGFPDADDRRDTDTTQSADTNTGPGSGGDTRESAADAGSEDESVRWSGADSGGGCQCAHPSDGDLPGASILILVALGAAGGIRRFRPT